MRGGLANAGISGETNGLAKRGGPLILGPRRGRAIGAGPLAR